MSFPFIGSARGVCRALTRAGLSFAAAGLAGTRSSRSHQCFRARGRRGWLWVPHQSARCPGTEGMDERPGRCLMRRLLVVAALVVAVFGIGAIAIAPRLGPKPP